MIAWEVAGGTDVGRLREGNEDTYRIDPDRGVFLVADGMGGHAAGEVASDLAASTVIDRLAHAVDLALAPGELPNALRDAVRAAHDEIRTCCTENPKTRGMGTTLTACILGPEGSCEVVHIGDSRLYLWRDGALQQVTHDHTWVQREVDAGRLSQEASRRHPLSHILTRVLSNDHEPEVDLLSFPVVPGDHLLLATDGLYNMLPDPAIAALLAEDLPLQSRVDSLVVAANEAGGADNITVVLVRARPRED